MMEEKGKEQGEERVDNGIYDTFFSLNDLAQIAGVLTATERLSELADGIDSRFGDVELCREVIRGVRSAITAIYTMGGVLYSVPVAQRMLAKYDVKLSAWTRFKMGVRFYARRMVVMWVLASMLSAAAAILLVARFAAAAYGVTMGNVPVAALGYLAAAIGGVCLPLAACVYMLKQIRFVYGRFVESVKVAKAIACERAGVGEVDEQEDHLPSAYFVHSVSDYDVKKSRQLVRASSICLAVAIMSLCLAFLLDAVFPLRGGGAMVGTVAPSLTLWYDFVVVGLSFMVGALLVVCGSSQFLHNSAALAQLRKAISEAVDVEVLLRKAAGREHANVVNGTELHDMNSDTIDPCIGEQERREECHEESVVITIEESAHETSEDAPHDRASGLVVAESMQCGAHSETQVVAGEAGDNNMVSHIDGPEIDVSDSAHGVGTHDAKRQQEEEEMRHGGANSQLHDVALEPACHNVEEHRQVA